MLIKIRLSSKVKARKAGRKNSYVNAEYNRGRRVLISSLQQMHIGQRIKDILDSQSKTHTVTWFARQLHCDRRNVYNIFARSSIDIQLLRRISIILNHNFFYDLAENLYSDQSDATKEQQCPESGPLSP